MKVRIVVLFLCVVGACQPDRGTFESSRYFTDSIYSKHLSEYRKHNVYLPQGFDPAKDIIGITVNRWAHGYAYDKYSHALFDKLYANDDDERYPHMRARKPFGRITVANADSAASAMLEAAVEQAHRAVKELQDS